MSIKTALKNESKPKKCLKVKDDKLPQNILSMPILYCLHFGYCIYTQICTKAKVRD